MPIEELLFAICFGLYVDRAGAKHLSGSSVLRAFGQRVDNTFFDSLAGALRQSSGD
jgi:hypothetical protein